MSLDFYYALFSAPCRACLLTARQLDLKLNMKSLNLLSGEQMKPDFAKINPEHMVPTLVDGEFVLWESRAICGYLVTQYGRGDWLYPEDPVQRAHVDKLLMFDMGTLYSRLAKYVLPVVFGGKAPSPAALKALQEALRWLDGMLGSDRYASGATITVADHCLAATVETIRSCKISIARHHNIKSWLARCRAEMPGYDENERGAAQFGELVLERFRQVQA